MCVDAYERETWPGPGGGGCRQVFPGKRHWDIAEPQAKSTNLSLAAECWVTLHRSMPQFPFYEPEIIIAALSWGCVKLTEHCLARGKGCICVCHHYLPLLLNRSCWLDKVGGLRCGVVSGQGEVRCVGSRSLSHLHVHLGLSRIGRGVNMYLREEGVTEKRNLNSCGLLSTPEDLLHNWFSQRRWFLIKNELCSCKLTLWLLGSLPLASLALVAPGQLMRIF